MIQESLFTIENYEKAKKYLIDKGMEKDKLEELSGYEVVLTAEYVKNK